MRETIVKHTGNRNTPGFQIPQGLFRLISSAGILACFLFIASPTRATILYQTGFEASEGYSTNLNLAGQQGWLGAGSGGNGIVAGFFPGKGQQAYVGYNPPNTNETSLFLYQPINKNPQQTDFSVTMSIIDSTTTNRDDFYWSVFNQNGDPLFTVDFDNEELRAYYYLDDNKARTWSGLTFTNDVAYQLSVTMNFASNRWSAFLGAKPIATNQPITTVGAALNLGDIDGAWAIYDPNAPGNNYMVFDDYRISATASATVPPPQLTLLGITNGAPSLRVTGLADNQFAVEASADIMTWSALETNVTTGGSFIYIDDSAAGLPRRFYRARWVP